MWAFAGVQAPGQQYNGWTYTTTNPLMGVSAKNAGRDLKADLLTIVSGVLAPGQFIVAGLMRRRNHNRQSQGNSLAAIEGGLVADRRHGRHDNEKK